MSADAPGPKSEPQAAPSGSAAASSATGEPPKSAPKAKKPGYTNPAFRAMGIPPLRLPGRNWLIFWSLVFSIGGGIAYDKYQQKAIRRKYMQLVEPLSERPVEDAARSLPRKVTVYVAPPPGDFLDESLKHFRKYVKPILNAAAVDFELRSETRQGEIRHMVAQDIREWRKTQENAEKDAEKPSQNNENSTLSANDFVAKFVAKLSGKKSQDSSDEQLPKSELHKLSRQSASGFEITDDVDERIFGKLKRESAEPPGVIIIGRGAYKEYLMGVHEALLGPLEMPERVREAVKKAEAEEAAAAAEAEAKKAELAGTRKPAENPVDTPTVPAQMNPALAVPESPELLKPNSASEGSVAAADVPSLDSELEKIAEKPGSEKPSIVDEESDIEATKDDPYEDPAKKVRKPKPPIPQPYILPSEFPAAELPAELAGLPDAAEVPTGRPVPGFDFLGPLAVVSHPNLLGFLNTPIRIYRYFRKRYMAEEISRQTVAVVLNAARPFEKSDVAAAESEETEWPKKWVQKATERDAEWVKPIVADPRVVRKMWVYDYERVSEFPKSVKTEEQQE